MAKVPLAEAQQSTLDKRFIFCAAASAVWLTGTRLTRYVDSFAHRPV
jgi:hypothetical protein